MMSRTIAISDSLSITYDIIENPSKSDDSLFGLSERIFNVRSRNSSPPILDYKINEQFSININLTNVENPIRYLVYTKSDGKCYLHQFYEEEYTPFMLVEKYGEFIRERTRSFFISKTHKVNEFTVKVYNKGTTIYFHLYYDGQIIFSEEELVDLEICEMDDYLQKVSSVNGLRKLMEEVGEKNITELIFESVIDIRCDNIIFTCGDIHRTFTSISSLIYFIKNNFLHKKWKNLKL